MENNDFDLWEFLYRFLVLLALWIMAADKAVHWYNYLFFYITGVLP